MYAAGSAIFRLFHPLKVMLLVLLLLSCYELPTNPDNATNSNVSLSLKSTTGNISAQHLSDTAGREVEIIVALRYPQYIKTIKVEVFASNGAIEFDTTLVSVSKKYQDTLRLIRIFSVTGEKRVVATAYIEENSPKSDTWTVNVIGHAVVLTTQPFSITLVEGGSDSFTVAAAGDGPFTYQWKRKGVPVSSNGTSATFTISNASYADSGVTFSCVVKDQYQDSVESAPAILHVNSTANPVAPVITGLTVVSRLAGNLILKWNSTRNVNFNSYIIMRSPLKASGYTAIDTVTDTTRMYKINSAAYYYTVTSLNSITKVASQPSAAVYSSSVNEAPQWEIKDTLKVTISENTKLVLNLADSVSDVNGDSIWLQLAPGAPVTDSAIGLTYVYTPQYTDSGSHFVTIKAMDGLDSSTLVVNVTVLNINRAPLFDIGKPNTSYLIKEGNTLSFPVSAVDPDGDAVTYKIKTNTLPRPETATITNGTFSWISLADDMSNASVEIGAIDYKDTTWITIKIAAGKVNASPSLSAQYNGSTVARNAVLTVNENDSLKFLFTITDPDVGQKHLLELLDRTAFSCGTVAFDSTNGTFVFVPSFSCATKDSAVLGELSFVVSDDGKNGTEPAPLSDTLRVKVKVNNLNRAPVFAAQADTVCYQTTAFNLKVNATDPDNDLVTYSAAELNSTKLPDSASFNATTSTLTWKPTLNQSGVFSIVFTGSDSKLVTSKTVQITVMKSNQPPVFAPVPTTVTVAEGSPVKIGVRATDPNNDKVTISAQGVPLTLQPPATFSNDTLYWMPGYEDAKVWDVTFTVTDGNLSSTATTRITVTNTNRKPVANPDPMSAPRNGTATITLTATDPDKDPLINWQITKSPQHGTQTASPALPAILYTPNSGYIGKDTILYTVSDGALTSDVGTLVITVDSGNVAPQIIKQPRTDTTVNSGASVAFTVEINSNCFPTPTFSWYKVGSTSVVGTSKTFAKAMNVADSGNYYVIVENTAGKKTTDNAHVGVNTPPSVTNPVSATKFLEETVSFSVTGGGTPPLTYTWKKVGGTLSANVSGANTATLTITGISAAQAGSYTCEVNNTLGPVAPSASAVLTVNAKITASADANGSITPNGITSVNLGATPTYTIAPNSGYKIADVLVNGASVGAVASYTFPSVTENRTIVASFTANPRMITPSIVGNTGGTISPSIATSVNNGGNLSFTITPTTPAYKISDVKVSGRSVGAVTSYTFSNVTADSTIEVTFALNTYSLNITSSNGTVSQSPVATAGKYAYGTSVILTSTANTGYLFTNWSGANYSDITASSTIIMNGDKNIIANFGTAYTITFDAQGGTPPVPDHKIVFANTVAGTLATSTFSGCNNLAGWMTAANGSGVDFTNTTNVTGNITVYAKWTITDFSGNTYKTVRIGGQTWMAENLRSTKYSDNSNITLDTATEYGDYAATEKYCWYNNDENANKSTYGALYNYYVIAPSNPKKIAPAGWHVSTAADWITLSTTLGGDAVSGSKLKEAGTDHWNSQNAGVNNESGFSGFGNGSVSNFNIGGYRVFTFGNQRLRGDWWTTTPYITEHVSLINVYTLRFNSSSLENLQFDNSDRLSVRLVHD